MMTSIYLHYTFLYSLQCYELKYKLVICMNEFKTNTKYFVDFIEYNILLIAF